MLLSCRHRNFSHRFICFIETLRLNVFVLFGKLSTIFSLPVWQNKTIGDIGHVLAAYSFSIPKRQFCPALSISQKGNDIQQAPNKLNQAKVCHCEPIGKLSSGMVQ